MKKKILKEAKEGKVTIEAGDDKAAVIQAYKQIKDYVPGKLNKTGAKEIHKQLKSKFKKNQKQIIDLNVNNIIKMNIMGEI